MRIDVFTIFPDMVDGFADQSLLGKARAAGCSTSASTICGPSTTDPHRSVDDAPFGGGAGMVLMPEPLFAAVEAVDPPRPLYSSGPAAAASTRQLARELAALRGFCLLCGRYEGVDERVREHLVTASCRSATTCSPAARWPPWRPRGGGPAGPGRDGQRDVGRRRVVQRRACSSTRSTPARRASGAGRCPRCCVRATTAASPGGAGPRRWRGRFACGPTSSRLGAACSPTRSSCWPSGGSPLGPSQAGVPNLHCSCCTPRSTSPCRPPTSSTSPASGRPSPTSLPATP